LWVTELHVRDYRYVKKEEKMVASEGSCGIWTNGDVDVSNGYPALVDFSSSILRSLSKSVFIVLRISMYFFAP
jgi:hypothetical protein